MTLNLAIAFANAGDRKQAEALIESARLAGAPPQDLDQVREGLLFADYAAAGKMVEAGDAAGAVLLLQRIAAATHSDDFHHQVVEQLDRLRESLSRKVFVDAYNHAVDLANHGDRKGAMAELESLLDGTIQSAGASPTPPPLDIAGQARQMLDTLKAAAKRRP